MRAAKLGFQTIAMSATKDLAGFPLRISEMHGTRQIRNLEKGAAHAVWLHTPRQSHKASMFGLGTMPLKPRSQTKHETGSIRNMVSG